MYNYIFVIILLLIFFYKINNSKKEYFNPKPYNLKKKDKEDIITFVYNNINDVNKNRSEIFHKKISDKFIKKNIDNINDYLIDERIIINGEDGLHGFNGKHGKEGLIGVNGNLGIDRKIGVTGKVGANGDKGNDYNLSTQISTLESLKGNRGLIGDSGNTGTIGLKGKKGNNFINDQGKNGRTGKKGKIGSILKGNKGNIGIIGQNGIKGDTGKTSMITSDDYLKKDYSKINNKNINVNEISTNKAIKPIGKDDINRYKYLDCNQYKSMAHCIGYVGERCHWERIGCPAGQTTCAHPNWKATLAPELPNSRCKPTVSRRHHRPYVRSTRDMWRRISDRWEKNSPGFIVGGVGIVPISENPATPTRIPNWSSHLKKVIYN